MYGTIFSSSQICAYRGGGEVDADQKPHILNLFVEGLLGEEGEGESIIMMNSNEFKYCRFGACD